MRAMRVAFLYTRKSRARNPGKTGMKRAAILIL
jgi:hypothetical protein